MLSLELFNCVPAKTDISTPEVPPRILSTLPLGYIIAPSAAHRADEIVAHYRRELLDGQQLNRTFHKSWETVMTAPRAVLLMHQLNHYFTTYGLQSLGVDSEYVYFPDEVLDVPELRKTPVRIIRGLPAPELGERCLELLRSGVALAEETIKGILELLRELDYRPTTLAGIQNREAMVRLADQFGLVPDTPVALLRFLVYKSTGSTLLIKNEATCEAITKLTPFIGEAVEQVGLERCAQIFNRFKPLWLSFKNNPRNVWTVNRLSKLAKRHHRPLAPDLLNELTARDELDPAELDDALARTNNFRRARLLLALHRRLTKPTHRLFRIRNGTCYATPHESEVPPHRRRIWEMAYPQVQQSLLAGLNVAGRTFVVSPDVRIALPTSEKMFVGNLPAGSQLTTRDPLTVGIYWENDWGATDLDLSAVGTEKVGWNAAYNREGITYSGDVTNAPEGATELLRFGKLVQDPQLVQVNVYSGEMKSGFKIIAGRAAEISENYMLRPDELLLETRTEAVQRQTVLGLFLPAANSAGGRFVLTNVGMGNLHVSSKNPVSDMAKIALLERWSDVPMLDELLTAVGAIVTTEVPEEGDFTDLRWQQLKKDTVLKLFAEDD